VLTTAATALAGLIQDEQLAVARKALASVHAVLQTGLAAHAAMPVSPAGVMMSPVHFRAAGVIESHVQPCAAGVMKRYTPNSAVQRTGSCMCRSVLQRHGLLVARQPSSCVSRFPCSRHILRITFKRALGSPLPFDMCILSLRRGTQRCGVRFGCLDPWWCM
jgi:hypothetical protein